ncbi:MAG: hypothetical protein PHV34_20780 [Verrucomicrobiae bacterium]|nr:hypothetical protein [Verrucomicrobiae bacterium]
MEKNVKERKTVLDSVAHIKPNTSLPFGFTQWLLYYPPDATHAGGPSIAWEAAREGVKDYKMLYTMEQLAEKAALSGVALKKKAACRARREVAALLDKIRLDRLNPNSHQALTGDWKQDEYGFDGRVVGGEFKNPTGFDLEDYHKLREVLFENIIMVMKDGKIERNHSGV